MISVRSDLGFEPRPDHLRLPPELNPGLLLTVPDVKQHLPDRWETRNSFYKYPGPDPIKTIFSVELHNAGILASFLASYIKEWKYTYLSL